MDFNKIKEMGLEYAEKGKNAALDLAEKGRTQAKIVNVQSKLYKPQSPPRKSPRTTRPRPAPSAARPSRTTRCSATSAAHSCKLKSPRRAVSPGGCRLLL